MKSKIAFFITILFSIISLILLIDLIIPAKSIDQTVVDYVTFTSSTGKYGTGKKTVYVVNTENFVLPCDKDLVLDTDYNSKIIVSQSQVLRIVKKVYFKNKKYRIASIYNFYGVLPLLFITSSFYALYYLKKKNERYIEGLVAGLFFLLFMIVANIFNGIDKL